MGIRGWGLLVTLALTPGLAQSAPGYVLRPESGPVVAGCFDALLPGITLNSLSIVRDDASAVLCEGPAETGCFQIRLQHPEGECPGRTAGFWCVVFLAPSPSAKVQTRVEQALAACSGTSPWTEEHEAPGAMEFEAPRDERAAGEGTAGQGAAGEGAMVGGAGMEDPLDDSSHWMEAWGIALSLVLLPLVAGVLWGRLVGTRLLRRSGGKLSRLALGAGVMIAPPLVLVLLPLGFWDVLLSSAIAVLGVVRGLVPGQKKAWPRLDALVLISTILAVAAAEWGVRTWLEPASTFVSFKDSPRSSGKMTAEEQEACNLLFPDEDPTLFQQRTALLDPGKRTVLHLGDSMVYPWEVNAGQTVLGLLSQMDPMANHVSAATPGTGPAFHLLVARRWIPRLAPDLVVMHLCVENDTEDFGRGWPCCGGLPLLVRTAQGPEARCQTSTQRSATGSRLGEAVHASRPPYVLAVASQYSEFARHLLGAVMRVSQQPSGVEAGDGYPRTKASLILAIETLRNDLAKSAIPLVVVLAPNRKALDPNSPYAEGSRETLRVIQERLEELAIPVLNAHPLFLRAAEVQPVGDFFLDAVPFDIHLNQAGHRLEAQWLFGELQRMTQATSAAP